MNVPMRGPLRLFCISDTHGVLPTVPSHCDIVLHAGDMTQHGQLEHVTELGAWCVASGKPVCVVNGNHEVLHPFRQRAVLEAALPHERADLRIDLSTRLEGVHVLRDATVEVAGLTICGLAWHGFPTQFEEFEAVVPWDAFIDSVVDVLLVHQPPGFTDAQIERGYSRSLAAVVRRMRPRVVVCGHLHLYYGCTVEVDGALVVNCAVQTSTVPSATIRGGILVEYDVGARVVLGHREL